MSWIPQRRYVPKQKGVPIAYRYWTWFHRQFFAKETKDHTCTGNCRKWSPDLDCPIHGRGGVG